MRTQLTRSITLFDDPHPYAAVRDSSPAPTGVRLASGFRQKWTGAVLFGTTFGLALCAPLLRHLH
ncbi:hypothetical protein APT59_08915 [Pseudomonas oryzihabitans]|uniref:Uncharacterized protein n=1 Tax=Pseudomonas oryzihabitans TaxID=47885 RepID=A0A0U4VMD2_9PSED|nr:hypothetical protein [Pseudomonas oryzihabitans]ALZ84320.1 hypothetical protein APT59_08915 [Pseudomonas oryzihabitans]